MRRSVHIVEALPPSMNDPPSLPVLEGGTWGCCSIPMVDIVATIYRHLGRVAPNIIPILGQDYHACWAESLPKVVAKLTSLLDLRPNIVKPRVHGFWYFSGGYLCGFFEGAVD